VSKNENQMRASADRIYAIEIAPSIRQDDLIESDGRAARARPRPAAARGAAVGAFPSPQQHLLAPLPASNEHT